jgi:hypothetical protein
MIVRQMGCNPAHHGSDRNWHQSGLGSQSDDLADNQSVYNGGMCPEDSMHTFSEHPITQVVPCASLMTPELVHGLNKSAPRLTELNHAGL